MENKGYKIALLVVASCNALSFYGGVRQGMNQVSADVDGLRQALSEAQKAPDYVLDYRNIEGHEGIDVQNKKQFYQIIVWMHNSNNFPIYAQIEESKSNLAGINSSLPATAFNVVEIPPGLDAPYFDNPIYIALKKKAYSDGRVDITIKYGRSPSSLTKILRVRGELAVDSYNGKRRLLWAPDDNSPKPIGMASATVPGEVADGMQNWSRSVQSLSQDEIVNRGLGKDPPVNAR